MKAFCERWLKNIPTLAGLILLAGLDADAQRKTDRAHVKAELISEDNAVVPGRDFWVGLHLNLEEGWHVYWVNPGDSGEPPKAQWELPPGFEAGPFQWPTPERIETPPLADYGYDNEVLLMTTIRPPTELQPGHAANLAATAKWLVCREICIPEQARLTLTLPVQKDTPSQDPARHAVFEATRARLPKPLPPNWKAETVLEKDRFLLSIETGARASSVVFFPLEAEQIENGARQKVSPFSHGVRISLKRSDQPLKPVLRLQGVVVFPSGQAYVIDSPVTNAHTAASKPVVAGLVACVVIMGLAVL